MNTVNILGKSLALIAALAPTAALAHCCCDHHHHEAREHVTYHREVREHWHSGHLAAITNRICHNYPASAAAAHASGETWIRVRVDDDGWVNSTRILSSSGRADLDRAALACVRHWHLDTAYDWREVRIAWHWTSAWG